MTDRTAYEMALECLKEIEDNMVYKEELAIVGEQVVPGGTLFFYQTEAWVREPISLNMLGGNGPICVATSGVSAVAPAVGWEEFAATFFRDQEV